MYLQPNLLASFGCKYMWKTSPWMLKLAARPWCCFGCKNLQVQVWKQTLECCKLAAMPWCCSVGCCVPNYFGTTFAQTKMCDTRVRAKVPYGSGASRQVRTCNSHLLNSHLLNNGPDSMWALLLFDMFSKKTFQKNLFIHLALRSIASCTKTVNHDRNPIKNNHSTCLLWKKSTSISSTHSISSLQDFNRFLFMPRSFLTVSFLHASVLYIRLVFLRF